jgi:uncharacterized membrane protein
MLSEKQFEQALRDFGFADKWEARGVARGRAQGRAEVLNLLKKTGYDTTKLEEALQ